MPKNPFTIYGKSSIRDAHVDRTLDEHTLNAAPDAKGSTVKKIGLPSATVPIGGLIVFVGLLLLVMLARIFLLQIVSGAEYREAAEQNRTQTITIPAMRGIIYDRNGKPLVKNVPNFQLTIDGNDLLVRNEKAIHEAAITISSAISLTPDDANVALQSSLTNGLPTTIEDYVPIIQDIDTALRDSLINGSPTVIRENIPYEEALDLMIAVDSIPGANVSIRYGRKYTGDAAYGNILGYISKMTEEDYNTLQDNGYLLNDFLGKAGIESAYEEQLRGKYGAQEIEVDFQGRKKTLLNETAADPGENIHLSVNSKLQKSLYATLGNYTERFGLPGASAVAIDPRNGQVLGLASYPGYDNNIFTGTFNNKKYNELLEDERNPFLNRPVSGTYPSGSTFKPIVAAAALEEDIINEGTTFLSNGGVKIGDYTYPDWKAGGHGITNVTKALAESVNTFFYYIGGGDNEDFRGLGIERIVEYAEKFGLNKQLGIDLPGEAKGFLPSKNWKEEVKNEQWYLGDTYNVSIGQGDILVTPLQVANYTAAIANGGTLYQPRLVKKIVSHEGEITDEMQPTVLQEQVVSPETIRVVQQGMREAVAYGSARSLNSSLPVSSAAKTGTAEFGQGKKTHAWFTVYAPYEDPEIALTVLLEEGGGGDEAALDIAEEILYEYFTNSEYSDIVAPQQPGS